MHFDGIWNDLELPRKKWKQGRLKCVHSNNIGNDIWNYNEKNTCFNCIKVEIGQLLPGNVKISDWCIVTLFGTTADKTLKTRTIHGAFWRYSILWHAEEKNESIEAIWCIHLWSTTFRGSGEPFGSASVI